MEKALEDSKRSIELDSEFVKGYLRKAQAERELLLNEDSLNTVSKALELDPENEAVQTLYEEVKQEWDDDHTVAEDNYHKQTFNRLETWLQEGGSNYEKLKIRFYNPIYRGVHAAKRIRVSISFCYQIFNWPKLATFSIFNFRQESKYFWYQISR